MLRLRRSKVKYSRTGCGGREFSKAIGPYHLGLQPMADSLPCVVIYDPVGVSSVYFEL
jgi:hypothetical protein